VIKPGTEKGKMAVLYVAEFQPIEDSCSAATRKCSTLHL
jgi:hypothetical protein